MANLSLRGATGSADLHLGESFGADRSVAIAGVIGLRGAIPLGTVIEAAIAGVIGLRGAIALAYDPNLLSDVFAASVVVFEVAGLASASAETHWQESPPEPGATVAAWQDALPTVGSAETHWQEAPSDRGATVTGWQDADQASASADTRWDEAPHESVATVAAWQDSALRSASTETHWIELPHLATALIADWEEGHSLQTALIAAWQNGYRLTPSTRTYWQDATYPRNSSRIPVIPIPWTPWGAGLSLSCPPYSKNLHIGVRCTDVSGRIVLVRRVYMSLNSAALVRWPDLEPLPCTEMTLRTSCDDWCWSIDATLKTDAWALVAPTSAPREVMATVNGFPPWLFVLDSPTHSRTFNSHTLKLSGRSRSAWLHEPLTSPINLSQASDREMQQLADEALDGTGWTVNWGTPNWVVNGGLWQGHRTPVAALLRLMEATGDCVATDPSALEFTTYPRWPVPAWTLDSYGVDLTLPLDPLYQWTRTPEWKAAYEALYVSGSSHGVNAFVRKTGSAGVIQPVQPVVDSLLCDIDGVGARYRGINELSNSGPGYRLSGQTLLNAEIGLITPGMRVALGGEKSICRSVEIQVSRQGDALKVVQSFVLERKA